MSSTYILYGYSSLCYRKIWKSILPKTVDFPFFFFVFLNYYKETILGYFLLWHHRVPVSFSFLPENVFELKAFSVIKKMMTERKKNGTHQFKMISSKKHHSSLLSPKAKMWKILQKVGHSIEYRLSPVIGNKLLIIILLCCLQSKFCLSINCYLVYLYRLLNVFL